MDSIIFTSFFLIGAFNLFNAWVYCRQKFHRKTARRFWIASTLLLTASMHLLQALGVDDVFILINNYLIATSGCICAILSYPGKTIENIAKFRNLKRSKDLQDKFRQISAMCYVVIEWRSNEDQRILDISFAMQKWAAKHGFAQMDSLKIGSNWIKAFPHEDVWLKRYETTALTGKEWENQDTVHEFGTDDKLIRWVWDLRRIYSNKERPYPVIVISWHDGTSDYKKILSRDGKIAELQQSLSELEKELVALQEQKEGLTVDRITKLKSVQQAIIDLQSSSNKEKC